MPFVAIFANRGDAAGMTITPELERWLNERLAQERAVLLTVIIDEVKNLLKEQVWHDAEAGGQGLEQYFTKLQGFIDEMKALTERLARIDGAARGEPVVDSMKMKMN
jgi:hypothetical protein